MKRTYTGSLNCDEIKEYSYNTHLMQMDVFMPADKTDGIFGKKPHKFLWWLEILSYPSRRGPLDGPVEGALPMVGGLDQMSF